MLLQVLLFMLQKLHFSMFVNVAAVAVVNVAAVAVFNVAAVAFIKVAKMTDYLP